MSEHDTPTAPANWTEILDVENRTEEVCKWHKTNKKESIKKEE